MNKYTLSLSTQYVNHWGFWEAIRELLQNAYDQKDSDDNCEVEFELNSLGNLRISTSTGELPRKSLLLGESTKGDGDRGSFGEGYKLSLLVLARLGHEVICYNNDFKWTPKLEHDDNFGCKVLNIYEEKLTPRENGVCFLIKGVSQEQFNNTQTNIRTDYGILKEPEESGRVYVGGLYVATLKDFKYGYSLKPGDVKLDRDRGAVNSFDLSYHTSKIWSERNDDELYTMIQEELPDVKYLIERSTGVESKAIEKVVEKFHEEHGANTIPVSTQSEVMRAQASGTKFALVSGGIKNIIARVKSIFIPSGGGPLEKLENFLDTYRWRLDTQMKCELDDIVGTMKNQQEEIKELEE